MALSSFRTTSRLVIRIDGLSYEKDNVEALTREGGTVTGAHLASGRVLNAGTTVNCTGAWAAQTAETVGFGYQ